MSAHIEVSYIYLDADERKRFAETDNQHLLQQIHNL